jgi:hypothetical protein
MKVKSGGGLTSNKLVQSKGYKQEPVANKANVASVAQQGLATQFRKEPLIQQGKGYNPSGVPATGIPGKYNAAAQGPGSGRTTYKSGSQSTYGRPVSDPAAGRARDILSEFGRERSKG